MRCLKSHVKSMGFLAKVCPVLNNAIIENVFFHITGLGIDELSFNQWQNLTKPKIPALVFIEMSYIDLLHIRTLLQTVSPSRCRWSMNFLVWLPRVTSDGATDVPAT